MEDALTQSWWGTVCSSPTLLSHTQVSAHSTVLAPAALTLVKPLLSRSWSQCFVKMQPHTRHGAGYA